MLTPVPQIAIIIRTYSRIMDTEALIHLIQSRWTRLSYTIFVVHNGEKDGHHVTDFIKSNAVYVSVDENKGHIEGAKSLVQAGLKAASSLGGFTHYLLIESDFWLLDDALVERTIHRMESTRSSLATTIWVENKRTLAVDFFIAEANFLHSHPELLDWDEHPEHYMREFLSDIPICVINELRPAHLPNILRKLHHSIRVVDGGRFRIFPKAPALTHHIETLDQDPAKGLAIKKGLANALAKEKIFSDADDVPLPSGLFWQKWARYVPQSWWYKRWLKR